MKKFISFKYLSILFLVLLIQPVWAQEDNIILKAMKDEMNRSLIDINYEGHNKPFYISYGITDSKSFNVYAALGSLVRSGDFRNRQKSVRILVGDYEFNDESLDNDLFSEQTATELQLPIEDDYFGIRRSLWTTTDAVYKGAAQKFKKHQATLKEENKSIQELPHRTFADVPAVQTVKSANRYTLEKTKWENYCKELSALFKSYSDLESSDVMLSFTESTKYFVNSEGTTVVKPESLALIQCAVQVKTKNGTPIFDQFVYYAETPQQLPPLEELKKNGERLVEKLIRMQRANTLEEEYSGPVLFIGYPVAQVFANALFSFRESFNASNALPGQNDFRQEPPSSLETRIGKSIVDNSISIKTTPKQKTFNGIPLLGSFYIDDEGVVPEDELILIEKGILKNLLQDRSLTKADQAPNGYSSGPGVVQVLINTGITFQALKDKLIADARKEGLDFAILIRGYSGAGQMGLVEVYKVSLDTGKEELMRPCRINNLMLKNLKHLSGTTLQSVHHVSLGPSGLTSFIVPEALLVEQAEVAPFNMPFGREDEAVYVQNPLKK